VPKEKKLKNSLMRPSLQKEISSELHPNRVENNTIYQYIVFILLLLDPNSLGM